jgi:hypothetical protein
MDMFKERKKTKWVSNNKAQNKDGDLKTQNKDKQFARDCSPYVEAQMSWHHKDKCLDPHNDIGSINVARIGMHNVKTWQNDFGLCVRFF